MNLDDKVHANVLKGAGYYLDWLAKSANAQRCESPIELAFFCAFKIMDLLVHHNAHRIETQASVGDFRVDFLIGHHGGPASVVVECDGRDFHHASWDQIERDRDRDKRIEALGLKVFRFPGTQLCSEPTGCVLTVLQHLRETRKAEAA